VRNWLSTYDDDILVQGERDDVGQGVVELDAAVPVSGAAVQNVQVR
jgi:hypothetical protein